jgi:hypothetical protein
MPTLPNHFLKLCVALFAVVVLYASPSKAQTSAAATTNVLTRVLMVRSEFGYGTIFSIDVDQKEYWITAKHILNGKPHPPVWFCDEQGRES